MGKKIPPVFDFEPRKERERKRRNNEAVHPSEKVFNKRGTFLRDLRRSLVPKQIFYAQLLCLASIRLYVKA